MIDTKIMERPRTFDEDEALLAAMNVFWAKDYDGASLKNLTKAMKINGPSMYSAFGDKRELYLKAIDRYADVDACATVIAFETETDLKKAVKGFLTSVISYATTQDSGSAERFLASCVIANIDEVEGVAERLEAAINETDVRLATRFEVEKEKGALPKNLLSHARAKLMYDIHQGYMFRGRAGWSQKSLKEDLDHA